VGYRKNKNKHTVYLLRKDEGVVKRTTKETKRGGKKKTGIGTPPGGNHRLGEHGGKRNLKKKSRNHRGQRRGKKDGLKTLNLWNHREGGL